MHRMQTHALTEYHMNGRVFHPLWNPLAKPSISSTPSAIFFVSSYQSDPLSSAFGRDSRLYWPLTFHGEWELWSLYRLWKTHRETQRLSMNLQSLSVSLEQQQEVSFYGKMPLKSSFMEWLWFPIRNIHLLDSEGRAQSSDSFQLHHIYSSSLSHLWTGNDNWNIASIKILILIINLDLKMVLIS